MEKVFESNRDGIQEVKLLAPAPSGHDETSLLKHPQVLHDTEARHRQTSLERPQGLPILIKEFVKQASTCRVGQGSEHFVHISRLTGDHVVTCLTQGRIVGDLLVTCQAWVDVVKQQ